MPARTKTHIIGVDYAAMFAIAIGIWVIALNLTQG